MQKYIIKYMKKDKKKFKMCINDERNYLISVVKNLTQDEWEKESLCAGWSIGEVVNHVMLLDTLPISLGWKSIPKLIFELIFERRLITSSMVNWQKKMTFLGIDDAVKRLSKKSNHVRARFGLLGIKFNIIEEIIHTEDIIRPLKLSRTVKHDNYILWECVKTLSSFKNKKIKTLNKVDIIFNDKYSMTITKSTYGKKFNKISNSDTKIIGEPIELLLFFAGRPSKVIINNNKLTNKNLKY